jgi:hypothetical protein
MKPSKVLHEEKMKIKYGILILILISLLALSGCKTKETVTETAAPESSSGGYPAPEINLPLVTSPGYPAPESTPAEDKAVSEPGYPDPSSAPVRENASLMQVEILSLTPSDKIPDLVIAHVRVNNTAAVEGFDQYDPNLAGQEIDLLLTVADAARLTVGDVIELTVSFRGDEWGSGYYGSNITAGN